MKVLNRKSILSIASLVAVMAMLAPANAFVASARGSPNAGPIVGGVIISCPSGYLASVNGCVLPECAFHSVAVVDTTKGTLDFRNGTHINISSKCMNGAPVIKKTLVSLDGTASSTSNVPGGLPNGDIWVEDAHYSNCYLFICFALGGETGSWMVPHPPGNANAGQVIFFFIGMTDYYELNIIQPVLQWGTGTCYGGGNFWSIVSVVNWGSSCADGGQSGFAAVNVGDTIAGDIVQKGLCGHSCVVWDIYTQDQTSGVGETLQVNNYAMYNAYATLEVYNVNACNQYPASGSTLFTGLTVGGGTVSWGAQVRNTIGCGEGVNINNNAAQATLVYPSPTVIQIDANPVNDNYCRSIGLSFDQQLPVPWWPPYQSGYEISPPGGQCGAFHYTTNHQFQLGNQVGAHYVQVAVSGFVPNYEWNAVVHVNGALVAQGNVGRNQILQANFNV